MNAPARFADMSTPEADALLALRPAGGFGFIMADPPWSFALRSAKGAEKSADSHYACAPLDWIARLPVAVVAAPDCLLWLWATNPTLPQALTVLSRWGFTFKTAGHWVKRGPSGKLGFGTGYLLRCAGEPFLIGTRGRPRTGSRSVRSVIEGPRREHSRKPDEAYAAAELLAPDVPRLDLFSRQQRLGWTPFGDQVGRFDGEKA
jgi:N6-adenosine-specific RNA methylase IME4